MQGLTELLFRKAYHECFPNALDYAISPFLSLTHGNLSEAWKKIDDVIPQANLGSMPVIPQILGKEPAEFVDLANRLYDIGYKEINWNIGCPMRKITAKHRGSGILPYPDEVKTILDTIIPQLRPSLSVKMRLGLYNADEIFKLIPILNDYPLDNITIHPRTGRQQYSGQVDLNTFEEVLPLIRHRGFHDRTWSSFRPHSPAQDKKRQHKRRRPFSPDEVHPHTARRNQPTTHSRSEQNAQNQGILVSATVQSPHH